MSSADPARFARSRSARAAIWFMRVQQGSLAAPRIEQLKLWLTDPINKQAFKTIATMWSALDHVPLDKLETGASLSSRADRLPKSSIFLTWVVAILFALAPINTRHEERLTPTTISTRADQRQNMRLDDGTVVEMNGATKLTVDIGPKQRVVRLMSGQATFDVAKDPQRPFSVITALLRAEAIGTRFSVGQFDDGIVISVFEGTVRVSRSDRKEGSYVTLRAGDQLNLPLDNYTGTSGLQ